MASSVPSSPSMSTSPSPMRVRAEFWERVDASPVFFDIRAPAFSAMHEARQASHSPLHGSPLASSPSSPSSPSFSGSVSESPSSGHSSAKKKKFRWGPRDSLASRNRHGRPGSKRYQRWDNEKFLVQLLSDSESDMGDDDLNFEERAEPVPGQFAFAFEPHNKRVLEPFLDITEELQDSMLVSSSDDEDPFTMDFRYRQDRSYSPEECFRSLKIRSQRVLKKHRFSAQLSEFDRVLGDLARGTLHDDGNNACEDCVFHLDEPFARLILHAVAEFYDLVSFSHHNKGAQKRTKVSRRGERRKPLPSASLSEYLSTIDYLMGENDDFELTFA